MSDWEVSKFKDHFSIGLRNGLNKPSRVRGSGVRMVNMKEIFGYDFIDDKTPMELVPVSEKEFESSNLESGDLLFARQSLTEAGAGKIAIYRGSNPTVFESHLIRCRINKHKSDSNFLYYLFKSPVGKGAVSTIVHQVAAAGIKGSDLQELEFQFPKLEEQKAIASVLSSLDDKIDLLHRQNTTLERMAETLFRQWFVEEAQEDWDIVPLGDLFEISSGKGLKKEQLSDTGLYPVLGANGEIGKTNDFLFKEKLIFTGRVGTLGNIFRVENQKVWLSDNTLIFRNIKHFYFVYFALKNAGLSDYNVGSTQPLIRQSDIKSIEVLMPTNQVTLDKFEKQADLVFSKINANIGQIQTLEKLRDNLLPKLMSGEVRVSP